MTTANNNILLIDKPSGMSSCRVVTEVKRRLNIKKAGHAGTLDPSAEGLLIVALGKATRALGGLTEYNKCYQVEVRLGIRTATGDREGAIIERRDFVVPQAHVVERVFADFSGPIEQIPPMYSALKYNGQRLYKLARNNISVARKKRKIYIQSLMLRSFSNNGFSFDVECSKGTYVRTLVEDIAKALNTIAYTSRLKRTAIGCFNVSSAVALGCLEPNPPAPSEYLIKLDRIYAHYDAYVLNTEAARCFHHGLYNERVLPANGCFRLYNEAGDFLGIGGDGKVHVRFI